VTARASIIQLRDCGQWNMVATPMAAKPVTKTMTAVAQAMMRVHGVHWFPPRLAATPFSGGRHTTDAIYDRGKTSIQVSIAGHHQWPVGWPSVSRIIRPSTVAERPLAGRVQALSTDRPGPVAVSPWSDQETFGDNAEGQSEAWSTAPPQRR
jgi:hypothetical protein